MKEKILETLRELGFLPEEIEDMGYSFQYEGLKYLYMYNEKDENFLNISIPGFYDLEDDNHSLRWILPETINSTLKYVKAYVLGDNIWLSYERELLGDEDLTQLIFSMIFHLEGASQFARKTIKDIEKEAENDSKESEENKECDNDEDNE